MIQWRKFNPQNLPPDGTYISRLWLAHRPDNPHYGKLTIRNGQCVNCDPSLITHYAEDDGEIGETEKEKIC